MTVKLLFPGNYLNAVNSIEKKVFKISKRLLHVITFVVNVAKKAILIRGRCTLNFAR